MSQVIIELTHEEFKIVLHSVKNYGDSLPRIMPIEPIRVDELIAKLSSIDNQETRRGWMGK